jgi:hypothetical protein
MARMLPDVDPSQIEHASEEPVYVALRDQLGPEYTVLHSYPWLRPWRDEALAEGEADFVIVHPTRGILVLEVKGGDVRHDGHKWFRDSAAGPREIKDPFRQAQRNMHALLDIVRERARGQIRREDLAHGYAVVFPHLDYTGAPPPYADKAIIISRRHLAQMGRAVETAYAAWTHEARPLSAGQHRTLLHDCLMPKFRLFRPLGPDLSKVSERLLELTELQAQVFEGLYAQDRVLVEGVAGSGKTFLALHRALAFARDGKRALFVCYNRELAVWLRRQVEDDPATAPLQGHLVIKNFHALAADLAADAGVAFEPASGGPKTDAFWDEEVPDLLEQAALSLSYEGRAASFDAIVVDEAQDFCLGWWYALTQSLLSKPDGPLYAFLDPNQSLRGEVQWPDIHFDTRFKLTINCRNTHRIATASASILALTALRFPRAPIGGAVRVLRAASEKQQKGLIFQEIRNLLHHEGVTPKQIALIGPTSKDKGSLSGTTDIDGASLTTSAEEWRQGGGVLVTTARSFKGLEAEVVILYDLGGFSRLFKREDLYVSCTRAKVLLIAVVHGGECQEVIAAAQAASEGEL